MGGDGASRSEAQGQELRLLIVEDSEPDAQLLVRHLSENGYRPIYRRVQNAPELRETLSRDVWDLVIADHSMPGFSGREAFDLLKSSGIKIPLIFVSGTFSRDDAQRALANGAGDCIPKGRLERLVPAVRKALSPALGKARPNGESTPPRAAREALPSPAPRRGRESERSKNGTSPPTLRRPVVLLVDDREENLLALEAILSDR